MRRGLPLREYKFLDTWYEDYMLAKYGQPKAEDSQSEEEMIAAAPWSADVIEGGKT